MVILGYQCQICTQVIHKKCLSSVVTICAVQTASSDGNGNHSCGDLPDGASPIEAIGMRLEVPHSWKPKTYKVKIPEILEKNLEIVNDWRPMFSMCTEMTRL